ncbi:MAG: hypothetical protein ACRC3G_02435 [Bacteroidales bacterium]
MRKQGADILITLGEWLEAGLSYFSYENDKRKGYLRTTGRACFDKEVEIVWGSIVRAKRRNAIIAKFGNPEEVVAVFEFSATIQPDPKAQEFFLDYEKPDMRPLSPSKRAEYITNAEILNALIKAINDRKGTRRALGGRTGKIVEQLARCVRNLDAKEFVHSLPQEARPLERAIKRYQEGGYKSLIHGNYTNKHAAKLYSEEHKAIITSLLADPRNFDNAQIAAFYNELAEHAGWKKYLQAR